jgi:cyclic pyranopterin phosphate synthase
LKDVVPSVEVLRGLQEAFPLEPVEPSYPGEVARRWRYVDGEGEIGFIASVTYPFCGTCTRARLSADGHLFTCLFAQQGHDLKSLLRGGADLSGITESVREIWQGRDDRYSELRSGETPGLDRVEMSYIGG